MLYSMIVLCKSNWKLLKILTILLKKFCELRPLSIIKQEAEGPQAYHRHHHYTFILKEHDWAYLFAKCFFKWIWYLIYLVGYFPSKMRSTRGRKTLLESLQKFNKRKISLIVKLLLVSIHHTLITFWHFPFSLTLNFFFFQQFSVAPFYISHLMRQKGTSVLWRSRKLFPQIFVTFWTSQLAWTSWNILNTYFHLLTKVAPGRAREGDAWIGCYENSQNEDSQNENSQNY